MQQDCQLSPTRLIKLESKSKNCAKTKKRPNGAAFWQRGEGGRENLSGKAMPDKVSTGAKTHGLKKSQSLEKG
jgi:hypothetical protein